MLIFLCFFFDFSLSFTLQLTLSFTPSTKGCTLNKENYSKKNIRSIDCKTGDNWPSHSRLQQRVALSIKRTIQRRSSCSKISAFFDNADNFWTKRQTVTLKTVLESSLSVLQDKQQTKPLRWIGTPQIWWGLKSHCPKIPDPTKGWERKFQ